jgi:hypothetical protein
VLQYRTYEIDATIGKRITRPIQTKSQRCGQTYCLLVLYYDTSLFLQERAPMQNWAPGPAFFFWVPLIPLIPSGQYLSSAFQGPDNQMSGEPEAYCLLNGASTPVPKRCQCANKKANHSFFFLSYDMSLKLQRVHTGS